MKILRIILIVLLMFPVLETIAILGYIYALRDLLFVSSWRFKFLGYICSFGVMLILATSIFNALLPRWLRILVAILFVVMILLEKTFFLIGFKLLYQDWKGLVRTRTKIGRSN